MEPKNRIGRILAVLLIIGLLLGMAFGPVGVSANGEVLEVSQPIQITDDTHYERGQSIAYDETSYWLFYGRSDTVTGNYDSTNPDTHDYRVYFQKANTVPGLASATPTLISGVTHNANSYLGETGAAYFDSDVWAFATIDVGATAELYGWWTSDGGTNWNEVGPIITALNEGQAHHDEIAFGGELWTVEGSGNFTTKHSATPKTGGWSTPLNVDATLTGGLVHFFTDSPNLYLAIYSASANYIYKYNDGTTSWDKIDEVTPPERYDPTLFKVGDDYVFAQAPWVPDGTPGGRQYIIAWSASTLDDSFFDGGHHAVTEGKYGTNSWVDMWPIGFTAGDQTYLFYTSERNQPSTEGTGNIWYLEVGWDVTRNHYTYIQEAINNATGTTISVAPGTYDETLNIEGHSNLNITGVDRDTVIYRPSSTISWAIPGYPQYDGRMTAIRIVDSTVTFETMTLDFDISKGSGGYPGVFGIFGWNSNVAVNSCMLENMSVDDLSGGYYELASYFRAPGFTDTSRANITFTGNEFVNAGRVGIVTHDYISSTISGNTFTKTLDDFGYGVEIGSQSIGTVISNTFTGYDTPAASDGSTSAGIYIENCFTGGSPHVTKQVTVTQNSIYDNQYGIWLGNEYVGYAGDVDIVATFTDNNIHDNLEAGVYVTDEDAGAGSSVTANFTSNTISDNGDDGILITGQTSSNITARIGGADCNMSNTFSGQTNAVRLDNWDGDVDARNNDWSVYSAPEIENTIWHNPDDASLGRVDYEPYCLSWGPPASIEITQPVSGTQVCLNNVVTTTLKVTDGEGNEVPNHWVGAYFPNGSIGDTGGGGLSSQAVSRANELLTDEILDRFAEVGLTGDPVGGSCQTGPDGACSLFWTPDELGQALIIATGGGEGLVTESQVIVIDCGEARPVYLPIIMRE